MAVVAVNKPPPVVVAAVAAELVVAGVVVDEMVELMAVTVVAGAVFVVGGGCEGGCLGRCIYRCGRMGVWECWAVLRTGVFVRGSVIGCELVWVRVTVRVRMTVSE